MRSCCSDLLSAFVVLGISLPCFAQAQPGSTTLGSLPNTTEGQDASALRYVADAAPKSPAGAVARPKDGLRHPDLDKAWAKYDAEVALAVERTKSALSKLFDAAAEKGDLDSAEKWQKAIALFEKEGVVPTDAAMKTAGGAVIADYKKAKDELKKAYEQVVKALTMEKKLVEAKAVRDEGLLLEKNTTEAPNGTSQSEQAERVGSASDGLKATKPRYYHGMVGKYANKKGEIPFLFMNIPRGNVVDKAVMTKMIGKAADVQSISCKGLLFLQKDTTVTFTVNGNLFLNGMKYFATHESTQSLDVDLKKGLYNVDFNKGNPGGTLGRALLSAIDKKTRREIPIFIRKEDANAALSGDINGEKPTEVSGWRPVEIRVYIPEDGR